MTYGDDITAPGQSNGPDGDDDFESADLYSDDEYDVEYDEDEDDDDDDDEDEDEDDLDYDENDDDDEQ